MKTSDDQTAPAWRGDWRERLFQRIKGLGFAEYADFLRAHPGLSYQGLAKLLAVEDDIAPVQLARLHASSVDVENRRAAILDSLARVLRGALRKGWGVGKYWQSAVAGAFASWHVTWGGGPELERLQQALFSLDPPAGWIPEPSDDPLLLNAAEGAWGGKPAQVS